MNWRIAALLLPLFLLVHFSCLSLELAPQEREYVRAHPTVRICVHPDWAPMDWIGDDGKHQGIAADMLRLVAERTGLKFEVIPTRSWVDSMETMRQGRSQLLCFINQTPERDKWLIYTDPFLDDTNIFITRDTHPFITDLSRLSGETLVLPQSTAFSEVIRAQYPNLHVITSETDAEALQMVADRRADVTMRSFLVTAFLIKKHRLFDLKIAGLRPDYANHLRIGVTKDEPALRDILNKGLASITPEERSEILNRHVADEQQAVADYTLAAELAGVLLVVLIVGFYWNFRLKRYNEMLRKLSQVDKLTGLYNRMRIDELFQREVDRAFRYDRPFSVLMLDIDHFKAINDDFGHQTGDQVLCAISSVVQKTIRNTDYVGRWGGEEFLVLCPETALDEGRIAGERICEAVRAQTRDAERKVTVSVGVAQFTAGESMDMLLHRADEALYSAKRLGRNRVELSGEPELE